MFNLSTQEVVLSIENTPLVNLDGKYFQEYQNFFGKNFNFPDITKSKFKKLTNQEHLARQILDPDDIQLKKLQIFFMNKQITNALEKKYELDLKFDKPIRWFAYRRLKDLQNMESIEKDMIQWIDEMTEQRKKNPFDEKVANALANGEVEMSIKKTT